MMYGSIGTPFKKKIGGNMIGISKIRGGYLYIRKNKETEDEVKKRISSRKGEIRFNPIEPVNLPNFVTPFLMLEYLEPMLLSPRGKAKFFVKFPVEIGVFILERDSRANLDIFSLTDPKYTLYGDVETGRICRYHQSKAYAKIPKADPLKEGVMEIRVKNATNKWLEMKRGVFNAVNMKIYYSDEVVSMRANIKLIDEDKAENHFRSKGLKSGMEKSMEMYNPKISLIQPTFKMESGI